MFFPNLILLYLQPHLRVRIYICENVKVVSQQLARIYCRITQANMPWLQIISTVTLGNLLNGLFVLDTSLLTGYKSERMSTC